MTQQIDGVRVVQSRAISAPDEHIMDESGEFDVGSLSRKGLSSVAPALEHGLVLGVNDIPAPLLGLNELEQVIAANREAREFLGLGERGWQGQPIQALLNFSCSLWEEFRGRAAVSHTHELELCSKHGLHVPATLTVRRTTGSGPLRYVCLISLADRVEATGAESSDQLAAMGQMIAGFAHEVRNPLAALKSIVEDLSAEPAACATFAKDFSRLTILVSRIERLVRSSLRLVQPERPNFKEQDPCALIASALDLLESRLRTSPGGPIQVTYAPEWPTVVVDEAQIVQVLVILIENALDAAGRADRVRIRLRADRSEPDGRGDASEPVIAIDVEDDGPGMSTEILSQIFNPFFTRKPRGTGLGLSIALKLLRENLGRIRVNSVVGKGSVFSIELPVTR